MKLTQLLAIPTLLAAWTLAQVAASQHLYNEHLELTQLSKHHLHADFLFNSSTPLQAYESHHYQYFPRSLAQLLQSTHTSELHLRFALGRWDDEAWGRRPHGGRREGGTGVEIWAWLEGHHDETLVRERWSALVNSLSGLFCASLNFIDGTKTTSPVLTFEPEGTLRHSDSSRLFHALLPREVICTENLTPFLKLLPCKGKSGISSLLDGHKLFDASWQSMSIDVRTVCNAKNDCRLEIEQGVSIALSIPRSMRDRHDPIPRPVPIEEIECDQSRSWNSHDSCYPKQFDGEMAWSLSKVFGRTVHGSCDLGTPQRRTITFNAPRERNVEITGAGNIDVEDNARHFALAPTVHFDLNTTKQHFRGAVETSKVESAVLVSRQMTGHGQERGGMQSIIRNPLPYPQRVVFFESLPWFIRPFMHTLKVEGGKIEQMFYTPLIDRKRGTHLELLLTIPAHATIVLEYEVEKAILRYTEYPPDANRGFDIGAAVVRVLDTNQYLRTTALLLPLPTPDFSMPYNVIILTSTVIALGFGSIFNLLVRKFVLVEEVPESPLAQRLKVIGGRLAERLGAIKTQIASRRRLSPMAASTTAPKDDSLSTSHSNGTSDARKRKVISSTTS